MLAEDFKPNRISKAKEKIKEFISLRPKDRVGMIVFGEKAFVLLLQALVEQFEMENDFLIEMVMLG